VKNQYGFLQVVGVPGHTNYFLADEENMHANVQYVEMKLLNMIGALICLCCSRIGSYILVDIIVVDGHIAGQQNKYHLPEATPYYEVIGTPHSS